jgi:hypothetical protein
MYLSNFILAARLENASVILWISSICISSSTPSRRFYWQTPVLKEKLRNDSTKWPKQMKICSEQTL